MTTQTPLQIWFLLDRSGSMSTVHQEVIDGFNDLVAEHTKQNPQTRLALIQFDGDAPFEIVHPPTQVTNIPALTKTTYQPRGTTPLLDAAGRLIHHIDEHIGNREQNQKPTQDQLVVIFTDGQENSSQEHTRTHLNDLITERQNNGWGFLFMGANQDSYQEAGTIGFTAGNTSNYNSTSQGTATALNSLTRASINYANMSTEQRLQNQGDIYQGLKEAENGETTDNQTHNNLLKTLKNTATVHRPTNKT